MGFGNLITGLVAIDAVNKVANKGLNNRACGRRLNNKKNRLI